jgi:4-hydroxy-3-methylbut-2-enyl diphosphate reductase
MIIELASSYGFCFGVKRAIKIAEDNPNSTTYGPLIHNQDEINRLDTKYNIGVANHLSEIKPNSSVVIRTHGIPKNEFFALKSQKNKIIDATCPYVTTPQQIVERMSGEGYDVVIFGDKEHPEIKSVMSYTNELSKVFVVLEPIELENCHLGHKVAVVSQTTRKPEDFVQITSKLITICKEVRVFNTICNATFENQDAASKLAGKSDVMIIVGGKHSSNTKQLHAICKSNCEDSYLIENSDELLAEWFMGKLKCGITAGASTPDWVVQNVIEKIKSFL